MVMPFIWGSGGEKLSPSQVKRYGDVAAALAARQGAPKTFGEGLNRVGEALVSMSYGDRAKAGEEAGADSRKAVMDALLGNPDRSTTDIAGALTNPWVADDAGSSAVAQALLGQSLKQDDPAYQLGLKVDQAKLDQLNNPAPVFEGGQWWNTAGGTPEALTQPAPPDPTTLMQNLQAAGLQPGTPEYTKAIIDSVTKPATQVNLGDGAPGIGKLSTDYGYVLDPVTRLPKIDSTTGLPTAAAVPGSPAAIAEQQAQAKVAAGNDSNAITTDTVTGAANLARDLAKKDGTTGLVGQALANLSQTDAAELRRQVKVLTSNATIESLNAMRHESPTGGALGNVTEGEGQMLAASAGAIDPNAKNEDFMRQLNNYERTLLRIVNGKEAGDAIFAKRHPELSGKQDGDQSAAQEGATATNPQTGERIVLRNGQWVPVQ